MNHVIARNASEAMVLLAKQALTWPKETRRGGDEMMDSPGPIMLELLHPKDRVVNVPHRSNSVIAAAAETLWVLAGRNDIEWLSTYLPRAKDFSDDGTTWRAGYGPRIRAYGPAERKFTWETKVDQLEFVVNELAMTPSSRRAVITIFKPDDDITEENTLVQTKDFPCTQSLSFMMRSGKLDLTVFIRSNDLVWGASGVNWFEFTVMQQLVAEILNVPVGRYYHVSNNLHVYKRHFEVVQKMAKLDARKIECMPETVSKKRLNRTRIGSIKQMDDTLKEFFEFEKSVSNRMFMVIDSTKLDKTNTFKVFGPNYPLLVEDTLLRDLACATLAKCAQLNSTKATKEFFISLISDIPLRNKVESECDKD